MEIKIIFNPAVIAIAAIIPLVIGFVWYSPKLFGNAWMAASGMTEDKMKGSNMVLIMGLSFVFAFFIGATINSLVIHQNGIFSLIQKPVGMIRQVVTPEQAAEAIKHAQGFLKIHEYSFRTFSHGAIHGFLFGLFFIAPFIAFNALFERKGFKYIAINSGFWIVSAVLMGGVICHFS